MKRIKTNEFFLRIERVYKWDLMPGEKNRLYYLALRIGAGLVIENFNIFYRQHPEGCIKDFVEWYGG